MARDSSCDSQVNNSNFFNVLGIMVLEGAVELAGTLPPNMADETAVAELSRISRSIVLEKTNGVIKPFAEAPDYLSLATVDNWSLGSLQYLFALGLPL